MGGLIQGLLDGAIAMVGHEIREAREADVAEKRRIAIEKGTKPEQFREMLQTTITLTESSLAELNSMKNGGKGKLSSADIIPLIFNTEKIGAEASSNELYNFYRMYLIFTSNGSRAQAPKKKTCTSYKAVRKHVDDMIETLKPFDVREYLRDLDHLNFQEYSEERATALEKTKEAKSAPTNSFPGQNSTTVQREREIIQTQLDSLETNTETAAVTQSNVQPEVETYENTKNKRAIELNSEAYNKIQLGQYAEATRLLIEALKLNAKYTGALNNLGRCCEALGQYKQAVQSYSKSCEIRQTSAAVAGVARNSYQIGDIETARKYCDIYETVYKGNALDDLKEKLGPKEAEIEPQIEENVADNEAVDIEEKICEIQFCGKCGKKIIPGNKYCQYCGAKYILSVTGRE